MEPTDTAKPIVEREEHLEGLRGVGALVVVLHHFAWAFFPAIIAGYAAQAHYPFEYIIYKTPLHLLVAGPFALCLFFMLSGYVLSYKFFRYNDTKSLQSLALRRYSRLAIPIIVSLLIVYLLMRFGLFFNLKIVQYTFSYMWLSQQWNFAPKLEDALTQGFIDTLLTNKSVTYNTSLWTMYYEFIGSFLVLAFLALFGRFKKRFIFYAIVAFLFWKTYFMSFMLGVLICDVLYANHALHTKLNKMPQFIWYILLGIGIYLGSYPQFGASETSYKFLVFEQLKDYQNVLVYQTIAAFLVLISIQHARQIKKILSFSWLQKIGRVSFSLYITHIIVLGTFSSFLFLVLINQTNYFAAFLLTFIPSLAVIFLVAHWYTKLVDERGTRFSRILEKKYFS